MAYISARQRVERLMLPRLVRGIVEHGANNPPDRDVIQAMTLLKLAELEAVNLLSGKEVDKIRSRAFKVLDTVTRPYRNEGDEVAVLGLAVYYVMKALIDSEYLKLHPGSSMDHALDLVLPGLEHAVNVEETDQKAQAAAAKILSGFQSHGYFIGVEI